MQGTTDAAPAPDPAGARASWPADPSAVPAARRLVREHLAGLHVAELVEDAELLVTELVTNVVLHVGGTVTVSVEQEPDGAVLLRVSDASPVPPVVRAFSGTASTGRGMRLVHSMGAEHGVTAGGEGKTVWARLDRSSAVRSTDALAAAFADTDWLAELDDPA